MSTNLPEISKEVEKFRNIISLGKKDVFHLVRKTLVWSRNIDSEARTQLKSIYEEIAAKEENNYSAHVYSESAWKAINSREVKPVYSDHSEVVDGRVVVRNNFDKIFEKYPEAVVFGEDAGNIGDVNQGLEGLQEKYGSIRISDTGIREATILGLSLIHI